MGYTQFVFKLRSRKLPFLIAGSLAASLLTFGAMPAQAADLGTVIVTPSGPLLVFSPPVVSGSVGDTFTVLNNSGVSIRPTPIGSTGSVSVGANLCTDSQATCIVSNNATQSYTVTTLGIVTFVESGGIQPAGPLMIQQSGSGDDEKAAWLLANPTFDATANSNGGTCTGTTSWQRVPYIAAFQGVFTLPTASECTRAGYQLLGWATAANASKADYAAGSTFTMGNNNVTLFAVWSINGVLIIYDANVGLDAQCLTGANVNLVTLADRKSIPTVVPAGSATATQAPCTPPGHTLTGWSLTAGDPQTLVKGAALPASFTGTSQTLYAKWAPDRFGLSVQVGSLTPNRGGFVRICAGVEQVATLTATKNGVAAAGQVIDVAILRTGAPPITQQKLMTDDSGRVQVNFKLAPLHLPNLVSGSFADQNIRFLILEKDKNECGSVAITGERTTLGGKSGIRVYGAVTGIADGQIVVPYIRFPGQTTFTAGSARPVIKDGKFTWERKTGERVTVYVTSADDAVRSNRVTIQAR